MALPPLFAGGVQLTWATALPGTALTLVGASGGTAAGVTEFDGAEAGPVPTLLVAVTVKVYGVPLARLLTVAVVTLPSGPVTPPAGVEVTV
jgi:hypothetical protein